MQPFVKGTVESIRILCYRVEGVIQEFIHHKHGAIGNVGWPVFYMLHQCTDDFLCAEYSFQITVRLTEKFAQPFFAADGPCKIQFMKNGELFFLVKDGYIAE